MLPVLNGGEMLEGTLASLRQQTFKNFRVLIQDGGSIDDTFERVRAASADLEIDWASGIDRHLADAWGKCLDRTTAPIVGFMAADERYEPDAIERAVDCFATNSGAVACTGNPQFVEDRGDGREEVVWAYRPPPFGLMDHLMCRMVLPMEATFLNREVAGSELRFDTSAPSVADYELWARIAHRFGDESFLGIDAPFTRCFYSSVSMSFRPEAFPRLVADKRHHLETNLITLGRASDDDLRREAQAGISMWAAEQLWGLSAAPDLITPHLHAALEAGGMSDRLEAFLAISRVADFDVVSKGLVIKAVPAPPADAEVVRAGIEVRTHDHWHGAEVGDGPPWRIRTGEEAWGYSAEILWHPPEALEGRSAWMVLSIRVLAGAVGLGAAAGGDIVGEQIIRPAPAPSAVVIPLDSASQATILVRSAGSPASRACIEDAYVVCGDPGD